jgi:large subunit ribosomal protein L29
MNAKEIRLLSTQEIVKKLDDARNELMNLRFQMVTGQLTDTSRFKQMRHEIARFETILNERVLASVEGES